MTEEPKGPPKINLEDILSGRDEDGGQGSVQEVDELQVIGMEPAAAPSPSEDAHGLAATEQAKFEELKERHLRLQADFENFRKRVDREKSDLARMVGADLLRQFLPVLDNLERALMEAEEGEPSSLREGLALIHRQALGFLERAGLEPIDTVGEPFNPEFHEAVERQTTDEYAHHEVIDELQKGYTFQGKLLRAAMVRVAYHADDDGSEESQEN